MRFSRPAMVRNTPSTSSECGASATRCYMRNVQGQEISLGAAWYRRGTGWSVSAAPRLVSGRYDDRVAGGGSRGYTAAQVSAFLSRAVGSHLVGSLTVNAQRALSGVMPSQRKFTVTSSAGVRGYPASLSSGDSGYSLRMQVEKASPFGTGGGLALRPFGFVDVGEAFDSTDTGLGLASSAGLGMSFGMGRQVFGDIYLARPLTTNITGWAARNDDPSLGVSLSLTF